MRFLTGFISGIISLIVLGLYLYVNNPPFLEFFGAQRVSGYTYLYNGIVKCGLISGWDNEPKCYCTISEKEKDERIEGKVFIPMEKEVCDN